MASTTHSDDVAAASMVSGQNDRNNINALDTGVDEHAASMVSGQNDRNNGALWWDDAEE